MHNAGRMLHSSTDQQPGLCHANKWCGVLTLLLVRAHLPSCLPCLQGPQGSQGVAQSCLVQAASPCLHSMTQHSSMGQLCEVL
jgi:hypothetical protein